MEQKTVRYTIFSDFYRGKNWKILTVRMGFSYDNFIGIFIILRFVQAKKNKRLLLNVKRTLFYPRFFTYKVLPRLLFNF